MEIIYLLIPLSIILVSLIIAGFLWAVNSDQFDDLEGPAHRILQDPEEFEQPQNLDSKDKQ
jgi:cbb3-type cytochrome oxidase maturation protein